MKNSAQTTQTGLTLTKEIKKGISKLSYYSEDRFIKDAECYISAIKQGRMFCVIHSVSSSGMSRNLSFFSTEKSEGSEKFYHRNYNQLFLTLGYTYAKNKGFKIGGCGMDMIFHTNYSIIHDLKNIGLITKEDCEKLAQMTPDYF